MKSIKFWLKPFLAAIFLHIALIAISIIIELFYSSFINPGKDDAFYRKHAEITGPWISGIFGSLLVFLIVRRYIKRNSNRFWVFALSFPLIYFITDIIILSFFPINWADQFPVLLLSNGVKFVASFLSYYIFKSSAKTKNL